jgi:hypothetical protein
MDEVLVIYESETAAAHPRSKLRGIHQKNKTTAVTERTEDERTEMTITQKQNAIHFKSW